MDAGSEGTVGNPLGAHGHAERQPLASTLQPALQAAWDADIADAPTTKLASVQTASSASASSSATSTGPRSLGRISRHALGDRSVGFVLALAGAWVALVALPLSLSVLYNRSLHGIPLFCVAVWLVLLRGARWLSPLRHCDRLLERGRYAEALVLCERELGLPGARAWRGNRRLAWLNRTTNALLGQGRLGAASVAAVEALDERYDPETLGNLGLCLLYLGRYDEAAEAARQALAVTRERSVVAQAIRGACYLRAGHAAEAQAAASTGLADVEALLPFVQPAHHVALLALRCQAGRMLGDDAQAQRDLATMRKVAERNPLLQASVWLEEADLASSAGEALKALEALRRASALAPHITCWYAQQPHAFPELRGSPEFAAAVAEAHTQWCRRTGLAAPERGAAPPPYVTAALVSAPGKAHAQPARHSSWRALLVQGLTLTGTLALLLWWTWHFFLSPG